MSASPFLEGRFKQAPDVLRCAVRVEVLGCVPVDTFPNWHHSTFQALRICIQYSLHDENITDLKAMYSFQIKVTEQFGVLDVLLPEGVEQTLGLGLVPRLTEHLDAALHVHAGT